MATDPHSLPPSDQSDHRWAKLLTELPSTNLQGKALKKTQEILLESIAMLLLDDDSKDASLLSGTL